MACTSLLTDIGAAQLAAALESGTLPAWTQMALGDGGGEEVDVAPEVTALVNQVYIGDLNSIEQDEDDATQVVCELILGAEDATGYTLREFGIYDAESNLVAYGSLANIVKPELETGSSVSLVIRAVVAVGSSELVELLIKDPVYVTSDDLEDAIADAVGSIDTTTAEQLATARTIAIGGLVTGTATEFDGTANITIPVTNVSQADQLTTARTFRTNLASTSTASFNGTANVTPGVTGILAIANGGTGNSTGAATTASSLTTARTIQTNLASTTAASFDGSANITPGVTGILAIANGGTGNSTGNAVTATALATARTIRTDLTSTSTASFDGTANVTPGVTGVLAIANGGTGNSAGAATTLGTSTVGSGTNPIYLSSGKAAASGSTVGTSTKPIYLSSGTLTASSSTVGSGTKPIYMSSGTLTASSSTVGDSSTPVYLKAGVLTECSEILSVIDYTLSRPGYVRFSFGLIIQWGLGYSGSEIEFPVSFTSGTSYSIVGSHQNVTKAINPCTFTSYSETGCTVLTYNGTTNPVRWIAIGY